MSYPRELPQVSVVFIFVNEALSVVLRSVHSVVNHTPPQLLKEVILVDDSSDHGELRPPGGPFRPAVPPPPLPLGPRTLSLA